MEGTDLRHHTPCWCMLLMMIHQGSCVSPLLFVIVMDVVGEFVRHDVPWDMLYADDLIIAEPSPAKLQERFSKWQDAVESKASK